MNAKILLPIAPVVVAALLWPSREPAPTIAARPTPALPAAATSPAALDLATLPAAPTAAWRGYALRYHHTLQLGPRPESAVTVEAGWSTAPLDARTWAVEVSEARVSPGGPSMPAPRELDTALLLHLDATGALEAITFAPGTSPTARHFLRALAAGAQLSVPAQRRERWEALEPDTTGVGRASYAQKGARVTRRKTAYTRLATDRVATASVRLEGHAEADLDADDRVAALTSTDEIRTPLGEDAEVRSVARTTLVPRALPAPDAPRVAALLAHGVREPVLMMEEAAASAQALDEAATQGASFDELRGDLDAALALTDEAERGRRVARLLPALGAAIRLDPSAAARAAARARAHDASPEEVDALAGALAAADSAPAVRALESMVTSDASPETRAHAAVSLALSRAVDDRTVDALSEAAASEDHDLARTAELALGAVARHLPDDAERDPVAALLARYATATGDTRRPLLSALANSGDPRIVPVMTEALASGDPNLAAAGAYGLRFVPSPEVDAQLAELLASHPVPAVRLGAARAVAFRDLSAWQARIAALLAHERDPQVEGALAALVR